jgi:hypothetical protein
MGMPDAGTVIGYGVSLFGAGVLVHLSVDAWLKVKKFERANRELPPPASTDALLEARLARIEQIVETTAIEMERVAEGQRFVARILSDGRVAAELPRGRAPERVITPH